MVERVFRPTFESVRLIPRHLLGAVSRNEEFLSLAWRRAMAGCSSPPRPATPTAPPTRLNMPTLRGGLVVRAHLNPGSRTRSSPAGSPLAIPVREIGLIALSLALLLAIATLAPPGGRPRPAALRPRVERDPRAENPADPDPPGGRDRAARPGTESGGGAALARQHRGRVEAVAAADRQRAPFQSRGAATDPGAGGAGRAPARARASRRRSRRPWSPVAGSSCGSVCRRIWW